MSKKTVVIINPQSNNRATMRSWPNMEPRLKKLLGDFDVEFTGSQNEATKICREFLKNGYEEVVAVGGDGTMNEIINGFFEDGKPIKKDAIFIPIMMGRGNDFEKTLISPKSPVYKQTSSFERALARIERRKIKNIDVGHIEYTADNGKTESRYFVNLASCGMSGDVDRRVNKSQAAKWLGGSGAFLLASFQSLFEYKNQTVKIDIDGKNIGEYPIRLCIVANGQYAGGGMWFAPNAKLDDGLFDVIVFKDIGTVESALNMPRIYTGEHLKNPNIFHYHGKVVRLENSNPEEKILLDIDGESPGRLPATLTNIPNVIQTYAG